MKLSKKRSTKRSYRKASPKKRVSHRKRASPKKRVSHRKKPSYRKKVSQSKRASPGTHHRISFRFAGDCSIEAFRDACGLGQVEEVRLMLSSCDNPRVLADDEHALVRACDGGHAEVLRLLIQHGADIHAGEELLLQEASSRGDVEITRVLLENGANVNVDRGTVIRHAYPSTEMLNLLSFYGADLEIVFGADTKPAR